MIRRIIAIVWAIGIFAVYTIAHIHLSHSDPLPCYGLHCVHTTPHPRGIGSTLDDIVNGVAQQADVIFAAPHVVGPIHVVQHTHAQ